MFRIKAIDHVVIRALDLERMVEFYRDVLGCAVERRRDDLGMVHLRAGGSLIDLVSVEGKSESEGARPSVAGRNMEHLCLRIEPFDYRELSSYFKSLGVAIGREEHHYGAEGEGASVYLEDPEGNTIELKGSAARPASQGDARQGKSGHTANRLGGGREMTKRYPATIILLIWPLFIMLSAPARAQEDAPAFKPEQVPAQGARAEDFLPRGWKVGARVAGDLNGDRLSDHVLQVVPSDYDSSGISAAPEAHALIVLLAEGGKLRRAAVATRLLVPFVPQYGLEASIRNGVLVINQNFGMTDVSDLTHRFRYDPATGRFLLIGKDTWNYHRPQGPEWPATRISENYLTGVRLTTTEQWLRNGTNKAITKRGQASRARVYLEDVDEDPDN